MFLKNVSPQDGPKSFELLGRPQRLLGRPGGAPGRALGTCQGSLGQPLEGLEGLWRTSRRPYIQINSRSIGKGLFFLIFCDNRGKNEIKFAGRRAGKFDFLNFARRGGVGWGGVYVKRVLKGFT